MSELVKILSLPNQFEQCYDYFPTWLCRQAGINKDPTVWLNGTTPLPKSIFKNIMSLMTSKMLRSFSYLDFPAIEEHVIDTNAKKQLS